MKALIYALIGLISCNAYAGLPPTSAKGMNESVGSTTFNFQFPDNNVVHSGTTALVKGAGPKNFVSNPSCNADAAGWVASGVTLAKVTTSGYKVDGISSCGLSSATHTASITSAAISIDDGVSGNCQADVSYKGDGSKWSFAVLDGSNNVMTSVALTNETSAWRKAKLNYPCTTGYKLQVVSTAASPADLYVGGFYWGSATNLTTGAQVSEWKSYTPTITNLSGFSLGPVGYYRYVGDSVEVKVNFTKNGSAGASASTVYIGLPSGASVVRDGINDGSASFYVGSYTTQHTVAAYVSANGLAIRDPGTTRNFIGNDFSANSETYLHAVVQVTGAATVTTIAPDIVGGSWSGYHDTDCSWTRSNASYGDPGADSTCTFTERQNQNMGTVISAVSGSDKLPGITFTPKRVGKYLIKATLDLGVASSLNWFRARLTDGTNVLDQSNQRFTQNGTNYGGGATTLIGIYNATSTSAATIKIQISSEGGVLAYINPSGAGGIEWSIVDISQTLPAPILQNQVSTPNAGGDKVTRLTVASCSAGPCSILSQGGSWVSSVSYNATGDYTVNIIPGTFSGAPTCTVTCEASAAPNARVCGQNGFATTSTVPISMSVPYVNTSANGVGFSVICMGPK